MSTRPRTKTTTTGVELRDLGTAMLPLVRNVASIHLPILRPRSPVFVVWGLTEACNLACAHCDMNRPRPDELDHAQRIEIAERLARSDTWGISLIGGEPLLLPHVFDYVRILKRAGKRVFLGTSGERLGRHVDAILETGLDVVTVSVDGATAESHDAFRRRAGLFARVVESVECLRASREGASPRLQVRVTITRRNLHEIESIVDFWRARADTVLLQIVQNNGLHQVRDPDVLFRPEDRGEFERTLERLRARFPFLSGDYYDLMARYVFEPEALYRDIGFRCLLVPATMMVIETNGRVRLCHGRPDSELGHALDTDLESLWRGDATEAIRRRMQSAEYGCMCWESANAHNLELVQMNDLFEQVEGGVRRMLGRT